MNVRTAVISSLSLALLAGSLVATAHSPVGATIANAMKSCDKPNHTACFQWTNSGAGGYGILGSWGSVSYPDLAAGVVGSTVGSGTVVTAGVIGVSHGANGEGVYAYSNDGGLPIAAAVSTSNTGAPILNLANFAGTNVFVADDAGNVHMTGEIYTGGSCSNGCAVGQRVVSYGARSTTPTLDDTGEAVLRDGQAFVALDPALVRAIDASAYVVTLTAEGDSDGLYVAARTARGFEVRESHRGHSTLGFAYRIVAHPFGTSAARLPVVDMKPTRFAP